MRSPVNPSGRPHRSRRNSSDHRGAGWDIRGQDRRASGRHRRSCASAPGRDRRCTGIHSRRSCTQRPSTVGTRHRAQRTRCRNRRSSSCLSGCWLRNRQAPLRCNRGEMEDTCSRDTTAMARPRECLAQRRTTVIRGWRKALSLTSACEEHHATKRETDENKRRPQHLNSPTGIGDRAPSVPLPLDTIQRF